MAKDIYVDFHTRGGDIKGDSRDSQHRDAVEVHGFRHQVRQPRSATASTAGGHTAERCEHGEMVFIKDVDGASPKLLQACSAGTLLGEVSVHFYRAHGGRNTVGGAASSPTRHQYLKIELRNVIVSGVEAAIGDEGLPRESFSLKYSAVRWTYDELDIEGQRAGKVNIQGAWDLARNVAAF